MNEIVAYVMFGGLKTTPESITHVKSKRYKFMWVFCVVWGLFSLLDLSSRIWLGHQFSFLIEMYWFSSVDAHKHTSNEFAVGQACCTLFFYPTKENDQNNVSIYGRGERNQPAAVTAANQWKPKTRLNAAFGPQPCSKIKHISRCSQVTNKCCSA